LMLTPACAVEAPRPAAPAPAPAVELAPPTPGECIRPLDEYCHQRKCAGLDQSKAAWLADTNVSRLESRKCGSGRALTAFLGLAVEARYFDSAGVLIGVTARGDDPHQRCAGGRNGVVPECGDSPVELLKRPPGATE